MKPCIVWVLASLLPSLAAQTVGLSNGSCTVRINDVGVLVEVPKEGLCSVDGPVVTLPRGGAEWYGLRFVDATGVVDACASGLGPDWANRAAVQSVLVVGKPDRVTVRSRIHALELETVFRFDPDGPHLLVHFVLHNTGSVPLRDVYYTREWQDATGRGISFPAQWSAALLPSPGTVSRRIWMFGDLEAGATAGGTFAMTWEPQREAGLDQFDVPLVQWTNPSFPTGLDFGASNGVSWGDYDRDGWIDVFCLQSARLWRNLNGVSWQLVGDFDQAPTQILIPTLYRYGASFGDYDNDGLPDLATEPRNLGLDTCFHLLHNLGGGPNFADVATPAGTIITSPCSLYSETACWADVDNDADLDLFLPVYPPTLSVGNLFWTNLGPTGAAGAYRFQETSAASGLDNPVGAARPEGAQFCDVDGDGDVDLYSNGTLYQNRSTATLIDFDNMTEAASGIGMSGFLDEGAMLFDYDLDGDFDLFAVYSFQGVKLWENFGDGMFFAGEPSIIFSPLIGLDLGMSAEDWDNDGDIDFTTRQVFRRNMLVETGTRLFNVATHAIPAAFITSATPAWGDWDHDGDLDCALGNWMNVARFHENTTYGAATPAGNRRYVRVKPLRDSTTVPAGLETEFGASVEIAVAGETNVRRKKFTASGHGYLNQNEYALHFALPADPDPVNPLVDLRFDVAVDFPTLSTEGIHRVDKHVNPALGAVDLASLANREIQVFRSGKVRINGHEIRPEPAEPAALRTSGGGLRLPTATVPVPAPSISTGSSRFVGLDFDTLPAMAVVRIAEIVLDGQLDVAVAGPAGPFNVALWDVTNPTQPALVDRGTLALATSPRNRRSFFHVNWLLPPGRHYRLVARVQQLRATTIAGPLTEGPITTRGGLDFQDPAPATGSIVASAAVDPTRLYLAIRFRGALVNQWANLGGGLRGSNGAVPSLAGTGPLVAGATVTLDMQRALPKAAGLLFLSRGVDCQPLLGGTLIPDDPVPLSFAANTAGGFHWTIALPPGIAPDGSFAFQAWMIDALNPSGVSATNAVWVTAPR